MDIEQARFNMIEQQIRPWEVLNQDVLDLLSVVRREEFVPAAYRSLAFADCEIPLPCGANMLTPKFEARMLQEAAIKKQETVLEIGTGSGYMAALLAYMGRQVTSVEIEPELKALAEKNLAAYGISNVEVALGNGARGWPAAGAAAPLWDVIVISGSLPVLPDRFLEQLKPGGRLLAVLGRAPVMTAQLITRTAGSAFSALTLFETEVKPLRDAVLPSAFTF